MHYTGGGDIKEYPYKIYINKPPNKTTYTYNDPLSIEGLEVIVEIYDGEEVSQTNVTNKCTFNPTPGSLLTTIGQNELVITYEYNGLTYTVIQDLEVENTLQSIAVTTQPNKTEYTKTQPLDITGLVVTATYANEATADVTSLCTFDPAVGESFTEKGQNTVLVTYSEGTVEKTTQFTVNVKGEATYYGSVEAGIGGAFFKGAHVGDYAIFVGGSTAEGFSNELVRTGLTAPQWAKYDHAAATAGSHALFAGNSQADYEYVAAYNASLVRESAPDLPGVSKMNMGGAAAGDNAIFVGGYTGATKTNEAYAYSSQLVVQQITNGYTASFLAGASVGQYAVLAGGNGANAPVKTATAYSSSLVKTSVTSLTKACTNLAGASVGQYAVFAGGETSTGGQLNNVDAYNESLVKTTATPLSVARDTLSGTCAGANVVFAGGLTGDSSNTGKVVDTYDSNLIKTGSDMLPEKLNGDYMPNLNANSAAYAGNYAIFRGQSTKAYVYEG